MLTQCPSSYARLLAQGWDSMQEAFDMLLTPAFVELLEQHKAEALERDKRREGLSALSLNGVAYKMRATGAKGFRWQVECDDYLLLIADPKTDWPLSIRYTSAGLWEHGVDALRVRALLSLASSASPKRADYVRVSRADYCFDFHSPDFTREFEPGMQRAVVCHSSCKVRENGEVYSTWASAGRGQTLDIGRKSSLQVSVYDKSLEITEASGKTWFYELWASNAEGEIFEADVWRLEVRMGSNFLKERNVRAPHELIAQREALLTEALYNRRLTIPSAADKNRRRWPLNQLWSEALRQCGSASMLPLGRKVTGRRAALVNQQRKQIVGQLRALAVLAFGSYDEAALKNLLAGVWNELTGDPEHSRKVEQLRLRYSDVEEAR